MGTPNIVWSTNCFLFFCITRAFKDDTEWSLSMWHRIPFPVMPVPLDSRPNMSSCHPSALSFPHLLHPSITVNWDLAKWHSGGKGPDTIKVIRACNQQKTLTEDAQKGLAMGTGVMGFSISIIWTLSLSTPWNFSAITLEHINHNSSWQANWDCVSIWVPIE